jgi:peptidoglycan biosynthesis protein MviN/MurJ (putative lipid II flippase)
LSYSAGAVSNLLEKSLSNIMGRGIVSIVDYSRRFSGILQSVLTGVLATVMVPALTFAHSKRSPELFFNGFRQSLQITLIIMVLGVSYLLGAANQICRLFYSHGDMDSETVHTIIILTRLFALAFIGIALSLIFGMAILSQQRGKDLGVVTVLAQVVMTVLNLLLFRTMHIYTFPITLFFSHILLSVLLFRILSITKKKEISIEILKYFGIMILLSAILIIMNDLLPEINLFFQLILNGIVLFSIFGILLYFIMKVNPLSLIKMFLKRRRSFSSEDKLI